jgi:hypothetical protein
MIPQAMVIELYRVSVPILNMPDAMYFAALQELLVTYSALSKKDFVTNQESNSQRYQITLYYSF